jgi:hypothetical protein
MWVRLWRRVASAPMLVPYAARGGVRRRGEQMLRKFRATCRRDDGMTTAEYAVGIIAAVAFAGVLYKVLTSSAVTAALTAIVKKALAG